ncbi:mannose-1-phosphate guanylyltransferase [Pleomorphomonas diazotrophica]|uniref:Mannose-1-phosphate guanylyltransferase n=1 Tax=Pleomorphomonas diazotrophica TaxID=1166257 RepID=A0A1I4SP90_9HYPH|nr:nucleotidyltransferase family protein [Pleomorphomonas diazotrophica]PKR88436.1 mannose-1-phosphate guanylyltransferase [Pleomorphomonas diazotrophica]SFM66304.1 MurNAc alpha-1-phosphate uridylyltransferase [Pleomorphomonas diazotrophica]
MTYAASPSAFHPRRAMVLAAGRGKRMRPITATTPKPLVEVLGRSLIDRVFDRLAEAGVETAVVNVHYLADLVEVHVGKRRDLSVIVSDERDLLLDTGGGVVKALPHLGSEPFYHLNSDSIWIEGVSANLPALAHAWDGDRMDGLLLLAPIVGSVGYSGVGDFDMAGDGRLTRRRERTVAPFVYAGAAILKPDLFAGRPLGPFSLNRIFDELIGEGRLHGLRLEGTWLHVGTPEAIRQAERTILTSAE